MAAGGGGAADTVGGCHIRWTFFYVVTLYIVCLYIIFFGLVGGCVVSGGRLCVRVRVGGPNEEIRNNNNNQF